MTSLLAPLVATVVAALATPPIARRLRPGHGARLLGLVIISVVVATWATAVSLATAYVTHHPWAGDRFQWCHEVLGVHESPSTPIGILAAISAAALTWRMAAVVRDWRRASGTDANRIHLVPSDRAVAYAEAGARGGVVITTAMMDALEPAERRALLAHEQSHLRHRHDRYLVLAALVEATPFLRAVGRTLRILLERWADEDAARSVGDRATVASAIARAALHLGSRPSPALAATGGDVPQRVLALLEPTAVRAPLDAAGLTAAGLILGSTLIQLHHVVAVVTTFCHH